MLARNIITVLVLPKPLESPLRQEGLQSLSKHKIIAWIITQVVKLSLQLSMVSKVSECRDELLKDLLK